MLLEPLILDGAYKIKLTPHQDSRGSFSRLWCQRIFAEKNLPLDFVQINFSKNHYAGTFRGIHYQAFPHAETKLVYCLHGRIFDVIIDMRETSATYLQYVTIELSPDDYQGVVIPGGCAHGYLTLEDHSDIFYCNNAFYHPESEIIINWSDSRFNIQYPTIIKHLSNKDKFSTS